MKDLSTVICGMGIYIPEKMMTSEEVENLVGYKELGVRNGLVKMLTGTAERHYVGENEYCSDLGYKAALEALKDADVDPSEVDALLFCSVTQDFAEPATANVIADKLDVRNAYCFDIKNGCNAFLTGMDLADSLIKTGKAKTVLVVSGEALSRWVKFHYDDVEELKKRTPVTLSIGDGGGAFVLRGEENTECGIQNTFFHTYPELWNNNVMWGGGVIYPREPEKMFIPGTTKNLVDKQMIIGHEYIHNMLEKEQWTLDEVDCIIPSQVAKWIIDKTKQTLNITDDKIVNVINKWGNVGAANIPLATYEARKLGKLKKGSKVIFYGGAVGFNVGCITFKF